jgi:hypothetical protein
MGPRIIVIYRTDLQAMMEKKLADKFISGQMHPNSPDFSSFHVALAAANPQNIYAFPALRGTQYTHPSQFGGQPVGSVYAGSQPLIS